VLLLGNSPVSGFYMPMFWSALFHLRGRAGMKHSSYLHAYDDGTDGQSVPKRRHIKCRRRGELCRRKHKTFRTQQKFEIKNYDTCQQLTFRRLMSTIVDVPQS